MNRLRGLAVRFLAYFAGIFAISLALWVDRMFGSPTIDQILYHLHYAEGAAVEMSEVFAVTFLIEVLGLSLVLAALAAKIHALLAQGRDGWQALGLRTVPHLILVGGVA